jgi:TP53 regulating kinase-like protein
MVEANEIFTSVEGSEARVELCEWYGKPAIRKIRTRKKYRNEVLDRSLRARRTKEEAEILHLSKLAGINSPEIYFADPGSFEIIMEFVQGTLLKDLQKTNKGSQNAFELAGKYAARLHKKGIIHGDLTTKNMLWSTMGMIFLDFGLSFISDRLEDKAEDLHLLKQALKSTLDPPMAQKCFEAVLAGYRAEMGDSITKSVRKQITKIELRGRYATVD